MESCHEFIKKIDVASLDDFNLLLKMLYELNDYGRIKNN